MIFLGWRANAYLHNWVTSFREEKLAHFIKEKPISTAFTAIKIGFIFFAPLTE